VQETREQRINRLRLECQVSEEAKQAQPYLSRRIESLRSECHKRLETIKSDDELRRCQAYLLTLRDLEEDLTGDLREEADRQRKLHEVLEG
jgi:hypothetical protein